MQIVAVPVLGIIFNLLLQCIEASLTLHFKVTKISANHKPANCNVANTTYSHGETFKLDCKTQCVCENGRHACSTLCPKEQLPAPDDTISCRSPRLVEVPGHCCKMWLCENPTADVYATCHNSSTSPWTPCSRMCGLGISTRVTTTTTGCNQLSNLRLCENRKCEIQQDNTGRQRNQYDLHYQIKKTETTAKHKYLMDIKQMKQQHQHRQQRQHLMSKQEQPVQHAHFEREHRIRKGHECRSLQRLGPARIRLGQCVSKKLYRPKICGRCHQITKCCVPSVSTTIQVELLCPLNAMDPISFVQQQQQQHQWHGQSLYTKTSSSSLWDTKLLDAIDQEYLQSHQIQIANKFIAVEWILKCECTKNDNCQRVGNTTNTTTAKTTPAVTSLTGDDISQRNEISNHYINNRKYRVYDDNENTETGNNFNDHKNIQNINSKHGKINNKWKNFIIFQQQQKQVKGPAVLQIVKIPDDNKIVNEHDADKEDMNENKDNTEDNGSDISINKRYSHSNSQRHRHIFNHKQQPKDYAEYNKNKYSKNNNDDMTNNPNNMDAGIDDNEEDILKENTGRGEWSSSSEAEAESSAASSSDEIQPDIIPYPPPSFSVNKLTGNGNKARKDKWSTSPEAEAEAGSSSSDEIQPDIIPYPPPPFSANKHTGNGKKASYKPKRSNKKSSRTNWTKDLSREEYSKQNKRQKPQQHQKQLYEHLVLEQHSNNNNNNNNKSYQKERFAT